jgi:hypothetical protein
MRERYGKTDLGRREIRERAHSLSRTARTLLLILDGSRSGDEWVALVQGARASDLQALLAQGLVAVSGTAGTSAPAPLDALAVAGQVPAPEPAAVAPAHHSSLGYEALYGSLNALVKDQLGLLKGYRYSLQVERASGMGELLDVAVRVVDEVRLARGENSAQMVRRALGMAA